MLEIENVRMTTCKDTIKMIKCSLGSKVLKPVIINVRIQIVQWGNLKMLLLKSIIWISRVRTWIMEQTESLSCYSCRQRR